jgi:hypothetical protein
MAASVQELEAEVLSLRQADRARLVELLLDSLEPSTELEEEWVAEALRREAGVTAGSSSLVPGAEALARVRVRLS